jgi:hypothetical protein
VRIYPTFSHARRVLTEAFHSPIANTVKASRWQGIDVSKKPEMQMRELLNVSFQVPMRGLEDLKTWSDDTKCNLPWADVHFAERVGGEPLNPGESWKSWPWGHSADKFRDPASGTFDHTYMERIWPKFAPWRNNPKRFDQLQDPEEYPNRGIRFEYGDLNDLVEHLARDPLSRQAYLPIWFPEDGTCNGRRPCTLGYHFINRYDYLHHTYYIRSCDFIRHWGDDCYLAIRLHLWILDALRKRDGRWKDVRPGMFTMHIVSLHMFENDYRKLQDEEKASTVT